MRMISFDRSKSQWNTFVFIVPALLIRIQHGCAPAGLHELHGLDFRRNAARRARFRETARHRGQRVRRAAGQPLGSNALCEHRVER